MVIYFTIYDSGKSIRILGLHYNKLKGKIEKKEGERYLIACHCILNEVLDKIKEMIGIKKYDDTKILVDTDDELPNYISLKKCFPFIVWWINTSQSI